MQVGIYTQNVKKHCLNSLNKLITSKLKKRKMMTMILILNKSIKIT